MTMMKKTAVRILPAPTVQILKIPILPVRIAQMLPIPAALIPAVQTLLWILQRTAVILIAWTLTVPAPTIWIPTVPRRNKTYIVSELF